MSSTRVRRGGRSTSRRGWCRRPGTLSAIRRSWTSCGQGSEVSSVGAHRGAPTGGRRGSRRGLLLLRAVSLLCLTASLLIASGIGVFYFHSAAGGRRLLREFYRELGARAASGSSGAGRCVSTLSSRGAVGELVAPSIGLVAPVTQGDGEAQLADAVGHVPTSVWPGGPGTSVLAGHDVTWFHDIKNLEPGQRIEFLSGCRSIVYTVIESRVVKEGSPLANVPGRLALVTCWPLNALWFTGQRLLVVAEEAGGATGVSPITAPAPPPVPRLSVPAALGRVDSLAANPTPLGTLTVAGAPAPSFNESPGPLDDAAEAQDLYFAALRAAEAGSGADWSMLAPGVPFSGAAPLDGASVVGFPSSLDTVLDVQDDHLAGAVLSVDLALDGKSSGTYAVTVTERVMGGALQLAGWQMRRL
ncbi:class D sortase [Aciditerrimonas ferrireducens]|uniref:Class D sortase n=1 Tax=Aciditerrimonas ferrireducens TaxID=667306 RepID=A0ABV6C3M2_9ACTN